MGDPADPPGRGLRYELEATGGFVPLSETVGRLPVAGVLDVTGDTGPAVLVADSSTEGLTRVDLDGFEAINTWE